MYDGQQLSLGTSTSKLEAMRKHFALPSQRTLISPSWGCRLHSQKAGASRAKRHHVAGDAADDFGDGDSALVRYSADDYVVEVGDNIRTEPIPSVVKISC
ncbi:hypothetical protein FOZ60_008673 [Perkinsus olseni]|uniref:Uncharacterized protein n=1 Tax=Perkinsus olseni TaxID=32597 RepID=A0A7J6NJ64_PEROL|nr:hypothetical protein FOZ60_008673 [Perkinsus olseni]